MSNLPTSNKVKGSSEEKNASTADPRKNISDKSTEKKKRILAKEYKEQLTGADKFWDYIKHKYIVDRITVRDVVRENKANQLHRAISTKKTSRIIHPKDVFERFQIDMTDYTHPKTSKKGYLFNMIDCFSRFAWSKFYMNKTAVNVVHFLTEVFEKSSGAHANIPKVLQSDNAQEFHSDIVAELCDKYHVRHIFSLPHNPTSNAYIERFNRTIKLLISRHQTQANSKKYDLERILSIYNESVHSVTNKKPIDLHNGLVSEDEKKKINDKKTQNTLKILQNFRPLNAGDLVRIAIRRLEDRSLIKSKFRKGYSRNWSNETYTVVRKVIPKKNEIEYYHLDEFGQMKFYRYDLLKISGKS